MQISSRKTMDISNTQTMAREQGSAERPKIVKRSILVLSLALSAIVFLTVALVLERGSEQTRRPSRPALGPVPYSQADSGENPLLSHDSAQQVKARGVLAYNRGDYPLALEYFLDYRRQAPKKVEGYTYLAIAYLMLERYDESEQVINEGMRELDQDGAFYLILAALQAKRGQVDELPATLDRAYSAMGKSMLDFVQMDWALHLQQTAAYKKLLVRENLKPAGNPAPARLPEPPQE